ncbi:GNAT family N-acetyltransferase [Arcobacter sp. F2176]|uniref:GNAT family N-acetyltransferase n=1 Tax=Arcobacter sp. F2176 TaxID=2044511 RepID=UPI00100B9C1C|nr:GNAT family N-acetyltransferase [Arcobacter sp. F2176]RXJ81952.1 GNAT family N-acetyltransferase [Arcobacter sp. F2176]
MSITIRDAVASDSQTILDFIIELAVYEKAEHEVKTNVKETREAIFGKNSTVKALICEEDGVAIGYAVYFYNYSTWLGKNGIYLEDLYVSQSKRGNGAGKTILKHLAKKALAENCGRFEWSCLDWNTPSREFYESLGAVAQTEWVGYRLEGETLNNFANS